MKISDLNNKQLVLAIQKYQNIVDHLLRERNIRLKTATNKNELYTAKELAQLSSKQQEAKKAEQQSFPNTGLTLNEDDLKVADETSTKLAAQKDNEEDLVRVTTLLKLSKAKMAKLQANAEQIRKKDKTKK